MARKVELPELPLPRTATRRLMVHLETTRVRKRKSEARIVGRNPNGSLAGTKRRWGNIAPLAREHLAADLDAVERPQNRERNPFGLEELVDDGRNLFRRHRVDPGRHFVE